MVVAPGGDLAILSRGSDAAALFVLFIHCSCSCFNT